MRKSLALIQASWRTQRSYRVSMILSVLSLGVAVLPVYFVSKALQPYMASSIADQGEELLRISGHWLHRADVREHHGELDSGFRWRRHWQRARSRRCCPRARRFPLAARGDGGLQLRVDVR